MGTNKKKMRAFGASSRIGYNSDDFYKRKLYSNAGIEKMAALEAIVPDECINRIYNRSSETMRELADNSLHLMVTSPPYNVGKEYDADLSEKEYREMLYRVFKETYRVLVPGGRACINVANVGRKPYLPIHSWIMQDMQSIGYLMRGEIVWNKGASAGSSCAWGSWRSPSNPVLRDVHEYILVFCKETFSRPNTEKKTSTIEREQFLSWTKSLWSFSAASAKKAKHPAPFPLELPQRLIQMYTYLEDIVLDPFMGSGTTALAALEADRNWVGYETSKQYVDIALEKINAARSKLL